ncbi:class I SAM-dependent methyltransferase [Variovorax ginsengisoli]|uniref:SAM-dependent methyltransferase n=1 Tax=Variovorax ginsengisoli TaxID=363844 RepID=A0ABT9S0H0_9BURK|nr:class I SAM-dependent methyltransferase [Variovorax ginsengisoli]MDP9897849.1 SAM-dependent methyltransferase [Variovorax ginsengisoli]
MNALDKPHPNVQDRLDYFDGLYGDSADPYGLRTRWYEQRKRAAVMAALPHQRYGHVYEPGCGVGELTVELAARCDHLLASDFSEKALALARDRTAHLPHVQLARHTLPDDWPVGEQPFDLVVVSEMGYFLDAGAMVRLAALAEASLASDGVIVACDWRHDFQARALSTDAVHGAFAATGLARIVLHSERDFLLQVWARDPRSVGQRSGLA